MINDKKFLITGASGQLAKEFASSLTRQGSDFLAPPEDQFDITNVDQVRDMVKDYQPDILLNCAAYNFVDKAEDEPEMAFKVNARAVSILALVCKDANVFPAHFSTDYVFDGKKKDLYTEEDKPNPINIYGESKLKGEEALRERLDHFLIFRLSWVFGAGRQNFLYKLLQWAEGKETLKVVSDEVSVPTFTEDVVKMVLLALEKGLRGTYHLTNSGKCSRYEWAKYFFDKKGIATEVQPAFLAEFPVKATRPAATPMANKRIRDALNVSIPTWQDATERFIKKIES